MTKTTNDITNKLEEIETVRIMTKILNTPQKEILKSIQLFSNIDPHIRSCLSRLYDMEKKDYITAIMLLDYVLSEGQSAIEIIDS